MPKKIAAVSGVGGRTTATRSPLLDPVRAQQVGGAVGEVLQLAPVELAGRAVEALPDHRRLLARVLVADVGGDVVALGHPPLVLGAGLLVGGNGHVSTLPGGGRSSPRAMADCSRAR